MGESGIRFSATEIAGHVFRELKTPKRVLITPEEARAQGTRNDLN